MLTSRSIHRAGKGEMKIQTGKHDPVSFTEVIDMTNDGVVVFRGEQLQSRIHLYNNGKKNETLLHKRRYAIEPNDFWEDGTPIPHCEHCKNCVRFMKVVNKKAYHLAYWCGCYQTLVDRRGNCTCGSIRTSETNVVFGENTNRMFNPDRYVASKVEALERDMNRDVNTLSTKPAGVDKSKAQDVDKSESCEQAQDVVSEKASQAAASCGKSK